MSSLIVELNLPKGLLEVLDVPESQLESKIKELTVLELFGQERISSGKGAELLGISKWDFIELLGRNNIAYFTESPVELTEQVAAAQSLVKKKKQRS
jgi:predicted HTH domain antitoxin